MTNQIMTLSEMQYNLMVALFAVALIILVVGIELLKIKVCQWWHSHKKKDSEV